MVATVRGRGEYLKVGCERLGDEGVPLHDLVEHLVGLDGRPHVPQQHLQTRPEGQQGVHEVTRLRVGPEMRKNQQYILTRKCRNFELLVKKMAKKKSEIDYM